MLQIVPYRESWTAEFRQIASRLRAKLGVLALRIDHIGSTAVPGLPAKDVIDIQITLDSLDQGLIAVLGSIGYTRPEGIRRDHRPPGATRAESAWEKLYFNPPSGQRSTHVHVRISGRPNQRYALLFRDYLRAHPAVAAAYAGLKRQLAQHLVDPELYAEVKDPAVDLIYLAAEKWAASIGWQPDPSDA